MVDQIYNILLADDDPDDCMFFNDALDELAIDTVFNFVNNGEKLMRFLKIDCINNFPDVLFLDLNMPRKSGLECLTELKQDQSLKHIPVIIYSTSSNPDMMDLLYEKGAQYYIRKPADFAKLKSVIYKAINLSINNKMSQPPKESFLIHPY